MKRLAIVIIFVSATFAMPAFASVKDDVKNGNLLYNKNRYDDAAKLYEGAVAKDTSSGIAAFNLGLVKYRTKGYAAAIDKFDNAIASGSFRLVGAADYNIANAQYRMGVAAEEKDIKKAKDYYETALKFYKRAIDLDSDDKDAKFNYEFVEKKLNDLAEKYQFKKDQEKQKQNKDQNKDQQKQQQNQQQNQQNKQDQQQQNQQQNQEQKDQQNQQRNQQNKEDQNQKEKEKQKENQQQNQEQQESQKNQEQQQQEKQPKEKGQEQEKQGQGGQGEEKSESQKQKEEEQKKQEEQQKQEGKEKEEKEQGEGKEEEQQPEQPQGSGQEKQPQPAGGAEEKPEEKKEKPEESGLQAYQAPQSGERGVELSEQEAKMLLEGYKGEEATGRAVRLRRKKIDLPEPTKDW